MCARWRDWLDVRGRYGHHDGRFGPPTRTEWLDHYLAAEAVRWRDSGPHERAILWYASPEVGDDLRRRGFSVYGRGSDQPRDHVAFPACSIRVHGEGKNLQAWARALVLEPPSSGQVWEQLLGRLHRPGQASYDVRFDVAAHAWPFRNAACGPFPGPSSRSSPVHPEPAS